jgi:hypothetical protein
MRKLYGATVFWFPATIRGVMFAVVAAAAVFIAQADEITSEAVANYTKWDWLKFSVPIAVALLNNIISFLDQTMGKLRTESETAIWKPGETV